MHPRRCAPHHLAETAGVPELVAEIAAQLDVLFIGQDVLTERRAAHGAEPSASAPYLPMRSSGSGELPRLLDISRPCLSRMMPGIDVPGTAIPHEFVACHDHARHPEENDVRPGTKWWWDKRLERGCLFRPAHRRKRPQPGTKPSVEHVGVLSETFAFQDVNFIW